MDISAASLRAFALFGSHQLSTGLLLSFSPDETQSWSESKNQAAFNSALLADQKCQIPTPTRRNNIPLCRINYQPRAGDPGLKNSSTRNEYLTIYHAHMLIYLSKQFDKCPARMIYIRILIYSSKCVESEKKSERGKVESYQRCKKRFLPPVDCN